LSAPLLEARKLTKHFPAHGTRYVRAVDGIDLIINPGETLGLVGESGCGKSTAARLLLGLIPPTSGSVIFEGSDIAELARREGHRWRRRAQLIFQDPFASLDPRMQAADSVAEPLVVQRILGRKEARNAAIALLQRVGLDASAARCFPHEFSGGQRQRIAIARAIATRPKLIVCDEPVSSLDLSVRAQIVNLLFELQEELGLAYLFIAHDLDLVRRVSSRVAVMYLGKIIEQSAAETFFEDPRHPYSKALLAASPRAGRRGLPEALEGEPPSAVEVPSGCRFHPRCRIARHPVCSEIEPSLTGPNGHSAACHFAWETQ